MNTVPIVNQSNELSECRRAWFFDEKYQVWCLEDVLYTMKATTPKFQKLSIFVPAPYMAEGGRVIGDGVCGSYTAATAPVIFENNSAGYMQMPQTWLGGPRDEAEKYLKRGMVYVTCGCRGRESRDENGKLCGKSPWTLVDLKTAIRFLRHNRAVLPGDMDKIISVGWSAGGAMSSLIGVTGNNKRFDPFLEENGAFMDEKDDVLAAQIYCPIIDLEHADIAYEWQFGCDPDNEASPAGPAGTMTSFQEALSKELKKAYITYFNSLGLSDEKGEKLTFGADGRSGSAHAYLMRCLENSAETYFAKLSAGDLSDKWSVEDYIAGNYEHMVAGPREMPRLQEKPGKKDDLGLHHAGAAVMMPQEGEDKPSVPPTLGDLLSRPPKGVPYHGMERKMVPAKGTDKRSWLSYEDGRVSISSLDDYILNHRRRMKPCTSFDTLGMDSGENHEFGTPEKNYTRFDPYLAPALEALKEDFPEEYEKYHDSFASVEGDQALAERVYLINPLNYIGTDEVSDGAAHYRIRVGAQDADTAFTVSMTLALKLKAAGEDTDYALVWDRPHCQADYPGEVCDWIESFTK